MRQKIRILLLMDEMWNDAVFPNNNMTNWFSGFDGAEFAAICLSEGTPYNTCCRKYFKITDKMMFQSIFSNKPAGVALLEKDYDDAEAISDTRQNTIITKISATHMDLFRLVRDFLWLLGRYDYTAFTEFIEDFKPDIVFSMRRASVKILRIERMLKKRFGLPVAAYTGDNELEEGVPVISPFSLIRRTMIRSALKKTAPMYSKYYTVSSEQARKYAENYGIKTGLLLKCAQTDENAAHKGTHNPIRMLYIGKLYCGRWKTLAKIGDELKKINKNEVRAILDIYTKDKLSRRIVNRLNDGRNSFIKGALLPEKINDEYQKSDIVLHIESFDIKNRAVTRHSYSTKVIDCLKSGRAVMAVGWEKHSACIELKKADSAIVVTDLDRLGRVMEELVNEPEKILAYAEKAMKSAEKEHSKSDIQNQIYNDFLDIIKKKGDKKW